MKLISTVLLFSIFVLACTSCLRSPLKYYNPTESDIPSMIEDLSSEDEQESMLASVAFGHLPKDARPKAVEALITELEKFEEHTRDFNLGEPIQPAVWPGYELNVILTLQFMGPDASTAIPYLIELLEFEDCLIRASVILALGGIRCEPDLVLPVLRESLADQDYYVRESAVRSLVQFGEKVEIPDTIVVIEEFSGSEHEEDFVRPQALIEWCIYTLEDEDDSDIWLSVIDLLKTLGADSEPALTVLHELTINENSEISNAAQEAIDEIEASITE